MMVEIPDDNSIIKWKMNDKDDWKSAEILDLINAYEGRHQGDLISRSELKKCAIWTKVNNGVELIDIEVVPLDAIDNAQTVPQVTVFAENADEKAVADMKTELQNVIESRPKGEWIKVREVYKMSVDMSGEIVTRYKCSKCGRVIATFPGKLAEYYPFCHCGAYMGGKEE